MALKIRLQRAGRAHQPVFVMVVAEASAPRDGCFVEKLGTHNPSARGQDPVYKINLDRIDYWLGIGAQPTDTAKALIKKARRKISEKNEKGEVQELQVVVSAA